MKLCDKIADEAVRLTQEYRKTDPRLDDPVRGGLAQLALWFFPAAVLRAATKPQKPASLPIDRQP